MKNCEEKSSWCTNEDVKLCQMKSRSNIMHGGNTYDGVKKMMCRECRKFQNGQFKLVK